MTLKWIYMEEFFLKIFIFISILRFVHALFNIIFAWCYHPTMSVFYYKPCMIFKKNWNFKFMEKKAKCICHSSNRLRKFIYPVAIDNEQEDESLKGHVRTMDLSIIQHKGLRHALRMWLNHILLRPTLIHDVIQLVYDIFLQVCQVLNITHMVNMEQASKEVRKRCINILLEANKQNKFGFRYSQLFFFK